MDTDVINDLANNPPNQLIYYAIGALVVLFVLSMFTRRLFGRRRKPVAKSSRAKIRWAELGATGPPSEGPQLSCFGAPVRLALLVIAPAGRETPLPPDDRLGDILDRAVPGLGKVFRKHQPDIHRWPGQLSASGFGTAFVRECQLPQEGSGTPWCSVSGPILDGDHRFFVGMLLRSAQANNLKQIALEKETQWLETLRISDV